MKQTFYLIYSKAAEYNRRLYGLTDRQIFQRTRRWFQGSGGIRKGSISGWSHIIFRKGWRSGKDPVTYDSKQFYLFATDNDDDREFLESVDKENSQLTVADMKPHRIVEIVLDYDLLKVEEEEIIAR